MEENKKESTEVDGENVLLSKIVAMVSHLRRQKGWEQVKVNGATDSEIQQILAIGNIDENDRFEQFIDLLSPEDQRTLGLSVAPATAHRYWNFWPKKKIKPSNIGSNTAPMLMKELDPEMKKVFSQATAQFGRPLLVSEALDSGKGDMSTLLGGVNNVLFKVDKAITEYLKQKAEDPSTQSSDNRAIDIVNVAQDASGCKVKNVKELLDIMPQSYIVALNFRHPAVVDLYQSAIEFVNADMFDNTSVIDKKATEQDLISRSIDDYFLDKPYGRGSIVFEADAKKLIENIESEIGRKFKDFSDFINSMKETDASRIYINTPYESDRLEVVGFFNERAKVEVADNVAKSPVVRGKFSVLKTTANSAIKAFFNDYSEKEKFYYAEQGVDFVVAKKIVGFIEKTSNVKIDSYQMFLDVIEKEQLKMLGYSSRNHTEVEATFRNVIEGVSPDIAWLNEPTKAKPLSPEEYSKLLMGDWDGVAKEIKREDFVTEKEFVKAIGQSQSPLMSEDKKIEFDPACYYYGTPKKAKVTAFYRSHGRFSALIYVKGQLCIAGGNNFEEMEDSVQRLIYAETGVPADQYKINFVRQFGQNRDLLDIATEDFPINDEFEKLVANSAPVKSGPATEPVKKESAMDIMRGMGDILGPEYLKVLDSLEFVFKTIASNPDSKKNMQKAISDAINEVMKRDAEHVKEVDSGVKAKSGNKPAFQESFMKRKTDEYKGDGVVKIYSAISDIYEMQYKFQKRLGVIAEFVNPVRPTTGPPMPMQRPFGKHNKALDELDDIFWNSDLIEKYISHIEELIS